MGTTPSERGGPTLMTKQSSWDGTQVFEVHLLSPLTPSKLQNSMETRPFVPFTMPSRRISGMWWTLSKVAKVRRRPERTADWALWRFLFSPGSEFGGISHCKLPEPTPSDSTDYILLCTGEFVFESSFVDIAI